jgi:hypothetical protein
MNEVELVIGSEFLEVALTDSTELAFVTELFEVTVQAEAEVLIEQGLIEVLALDAVPAWVLATKITVSNTAPANPRIGDVWIVKA